MWSDSIDVRLLTSDATTADGVIVNSDATTADGVTLLQRTGIVTLDINKRYERSSTCIMTYISSLYQLYCSMNIYLFIVTSMASHV